MAENPQLEIGFVPGADIYVNTFRAEPELNQFAALSWPEPSLPPEVPRRVLRLPIFIRAVTEWRAQPAALGQFFGMPTFPALFSLALSNANGDILREALITPVILNLLKDGVIHLQPGEEVRTHIRLALFDLASLGNQDVYVTLQLDPLNQYPGVFQTAFAFWRLGSYSVLPYPLPRSLLVTQPKIKELTAPPVQDTVLHGDVPGPTA